MEVIYDLPLPDVRDRAIKNSESLEKGDVVVYSRRDGLGCYTTGVMVFESYHYFRLASNWECYGSVWYNDYIDDRIELYEANEDEKSWGLRAFFDSEYCRGEGRKGLDAILKFVNDSFPNEKTIGWRKMQYCRDMMAELPWCVEDIDWNEAKNELGKMANKEILNTGLQFDKSRVELFCFLIGVLMIANSTTDEYELTKLLRKFKHNWYHFVWMYALIIGRLMGTELKNFTGVVHQLDNCARVPYLHLYLPLIEGNVDKICKYNPSEKRYKLVNAIKKMQGVEALEKKKTDLDEIYRIIFPKHFRQAMAVNRPAATIDGLRQVIVAKDNTIAELAHKLDTSINVHKKQTEQLFKDFETLANASVTFEEIEKGLLRLSRSTAEDVLARLVITIADNKRFMEVYPELLKKVQQNDIPTFSINAQPGSTVNAGCEMKNPEFKVIPPSQEQQPALESNEKSDKKVLI